ncbi:oxidoreductase [Rhodococcoides trifolii]|uniref:Oxidoreductase n=1 Tax=Rhodococcoides trifolii TaxID=908250 RepID=A0A917G843_9NOCA|nr:VOC family protein [Rhodococcus trifolii]GGG26848.1 oxidoreductase [Rhodococcus trifolii]
MTFSPITHLRHVDIAVPDFAKQVDFYGGRWGLTATETESGLTYFAAEGSPEQYIVRVRDDVDKRLDLIAFGVTDAKAVDALASSLIAGGVTLISEPGALNTPGGGYGFRFFDGDGRVVEASADVAVRKHRKIEVRESIPVRLSHVVLNSPQPEKTVAWYEKHLGFRLSDTLDHPHLGGLMYFLRCGPQHHSMAVSRCPHTSLNHISFEMRGLDEYMFATGRLMRAEIPKIWGPGRHAAGDNTFSYFRDPNGNIMEYTTELLQLDEDTWHPSIYDTADPETSDQWGTSNPMDEWVSSQMFNDADKGLYTAPPV